MCTEADDPEPAPRVDADVEPFLDDARLRSGRIFMDLLTIPGVIFTHAATSETTRHGPAADLRGCGHDVRVHSGIQVPRMILTYGMMPPVPNLAVGAVGGSVRRRRENLEPASRGLIGASLVVDTPVPAVMIPGVMVAVAPRVPAGSRDGWAFRRSTFPSPVCRYVRRRSRPSSIHARRATSCMKGTLPTA